METKLTLRLNDNVIERAKIYAKNQRISLIVNILPLDDKIVGVALNDDSFNDFEDGLQYFTAIENNQDIIITRNLKDFKASKLPVMTAKQFLETFK